jgi:hypothetical protein
MKTLYGIVPALAGIMGIGAPALAQRTTPDALVANAVETVQRQYNSSFGAHPQLYNGPEYIDYARRYHAQIGHQFFRVPGLQSGDVYYNNHYFPNVRLSYDVVLDQVVVPQPTSPLTLRLVNERVRSFTVDGHHFIRLVADSTAGGVIRTGYYEVLADSRVQLLAKRAKRTQEQISDRLIDIEFIPMDRLFIKKTDRYYPVSSKSAVVRVFADREREVQQFIQSNKLKFSKLQLEASVVQLTQYYNGLPAQ